MSATCDFADANTEGAEATADYCYAHQDFCDIVIVAIPRSVAHAHWRSGVITDDQERVMSEACGTALYGFSAEDYI